MFLSKENTTIYIEKIVIILIAKKNLPVLSNPFLSNKSLCKFEFEITSSKENSKNSI